jgi:hypothetical protein
MIFVGFSLKIFAGKQKQNKVKNENKNLKKTHQGSISSTF